MKKALIENCFGNPMKFDFPHHMIVINQIQASELPYTKLPEKTWN